MVHRKFITMLAIMLMVGAASLANTQTIWDQSTVSIPYQGPGPVVMYNVPNGSGSAFTEARDPNGIVDATITVFLRDSNGDPIPYYPAEDLWIEIDGVCPCGLWSMMADYSGDAQGRLFWVDPREAGGWSYGPTVVMFSGSPIVNGDLPIGHNSPDINCDLFVNLSDVSLFAGDFFGDYAFRSDFHYDGVIDLLDLTKFAETLGVACP
jgi:hypothetical protein